MVFSRQEYWSGLPCPSPVDHILSDLSTMTCPSWVALCSMAHSFIELGKAVVHVITLVSFLWLWFQSVWPLMPSLRVYRLTGVSDLGHGVSPHRHCSWSWMWDISSWLLPTLAPCSLDNILKSRDITLLTKVYILKAMVFPVVMYLCERWTIKKAECWRINAFKLWCWRRHLRVTGTERRSNQWILKEISPEYSLEGLKVKLERTQGETWSCKPLDAKNWLTGKDPDAGKKWRQENKGMTEDEMVGWHHRLDGHEFEGASGVGDGQEAWSAAVHGVTKSRTWLSNWTELIGKNAIHLHHWWEYKLVQPL